MLLGADVEHYIKSSVPPNSARFRHLDAEKLAEFFQLEKDEIVRSRSDMQPMVIASTHGVRKEDGSWRFWGEFA